VRSHKIVSHLVEDVEALLLLSAEVSAPSDYESLRMRRLATLKVQQDAGRVGSIAGRRQRHNGRLGEHGKRQLLVDDVTVIVFRVTDHLTDDLPLIATVRHHHRHVFSVKNSASIYFIKLSVFSRYGLIFIIWTIHSIEILETYCANLHLGPTCLPRQWRRRSVAIGRAKKGHRKSRPSVLH
jgi:hypothetical protein